MAQLKQQQNLSPKIALVSPYAPNQFGPNFFHDINNFYTKLQDFSVVIGGDRTWYWIQYSTTLRWSNSPAATLYLFSKVSCRIIASDLYLVINPTSKQFSFYSNRHKSYSRIHYLLTSSNTFYQTIM